MRIEVYDFLLLKCPGENLNFAWIYKKVQQTSVSKIAFVSGVKMEIADGMHKIDSFL